MSDLFSEHWMKKYQSEWNKDSELTSRLDRAGFSAVIGYGFTDEEHPRASITVESGRIVRAGPYSGESLDWDLRAKERHWQNWLQLEIGSTSLGLAYDTGKLKFLAGDFKLMIKNPDLYRSFIRSFSAMGRAAEEINRAA
jgi:hypothetical protein